MRSAGRLCGVPVESVVETMRPQPLEALDDVPPFVTGVSLIRGSAVPVVDLGALLSGERSGSPSRLVTLRPERGRVVGLLVDGVLGVASREGLVAATSPPLLDGAAGGMVEALARLDDRLLTVLRAGSILPEGWASRHEERTSVA